MKKFLFLLLFASHTLAGPVECIKAGVSFVYVPLGVYTLTTTLVVPSRVTIFCEEGAVFEAAEGAFKGTHDALIHLKSSTDVEIHHCTFRMLKSLYTEENGYPVSEFRHALWLEGVTRVKLFHVITEFSGGDGVCISSFVDGDFSENHTPSRDVEISNLLAKGNYRTGVAIVSCVNCFIHDSVFQDTKGISTQSGLIVEPAHGGDRADQIRVHRCLSKNNGGSAFRVNLDRQNQNSKPISIQFQDNRGEQIPLGWQLIQVDDFNWNQAGVKPKGHISWDSSIWSNT